MTSELERQAAKLALELAGQIGTKGIFPIDDDKIVTSTNMIVGAYTIAAQPIAPCLLSVLATANGTADTMGTITFVGTDINGDALTEVVTPIAGTTVYTTNEFASVASATGAGWVIAVGNDTIKIGVASAVSGEGYYFSAIQVVAQAVVASQTNKSGSIVAALTDFTALPVGTYPTKLTKIALTSGEAIGILSRTE
jgi:hypothetical protein